MKSAFRLLPYSIIALALAGAIGSDFGGGFQEASAQSVGTAPPSNQQSTSQGGQSGQRSGDSRRGAGGGPPGAPCGTAPTGPNSTEQGWWSIDDIKKELGLTPSQVAQEQKLWDDARPILLNLHDEEVKQDKELNQLLEERKVTPEVIALHLDYVEAPRTQAHKARIVMLYRMSLVLTPDQNKKLKAIYQRNCAGERGRHDGPHYPN